MALRINVIIILLISLKFYASKAQTWIKSGYWHDGGRLSISRINSSLYTHLICAFADLNSTSYEVSISGSSSNDESSCSGFTNIVKQKNPSITTLLCIGGGNANYSSFSSMVSNSSHRKSFIDSSIRIARLYGFQGLDLSWVSVNTNDDVANLGTLFQEWRAAVASEPRNSEELILTASVHYSPELDSGTTLPVDSIERNLNWVHVLAYDYYTPSRYNFTVAQAALYDPISTVNTDFGIKSWINRGLKASKLVLSLPFYGYAWTLANPTNNSIGAPATGPAITEDGLVGYIDIKNFVEQSGSRILYNATYVVNYCFSGSTWICFDDVEAVRTKVSYARENKLLGYVAFAVSNDYNWQLSLAAQLEDDQGRKKKKPLLVIVLTTSISAAVILVIGFILYNRRTRMLGSKVSRLGKNKAAAAGDFDSNDPNLVAYSLADIDKATTNFSIENKLGEGGFGPVYKGVLDGQEIAVKKLSKTSTQGFEEFKNEVMLTAKLQHVNLVRVLGFCIDREEQMLIYEYMPNKSLDYYLFDPIRRYLLDWRKRVEIIQGVTQGLLYLQEYSRLTIIHRDLKPSNILLDADMKPKISDFGMARIFTGGLEAFTDRIVGTLGFTPPEYIKKGLYSTKSDVYSFGVLLLQIITGKKNVLMYGPEENLSLLEYAYEMWKDGKGMEIMDVSLDDALSTCKLILCLQIALLCLQEDPNDRPSMLEVASMLKNEMAAVNIPKRPAFSTRNNYDECDRPNSVLPLPNFSVNDVTISQVAGR